MSQSHVRSLDGGLQLPRKDNSNLRLRDVKMIDLENTKSPFSRNFKEAEGKVEVVLHRSSRWTVVRSQVAEHKDLGLSFKGWISMFRTTSAATISTN